MLLFWILHLERQFWVESGVIRQAPVFIKFYCNTQPCPLVYVWSMQIWAAAAETTESTINDHYLAILQKKFEHPWPIMINSDRIQKQKVWVCILALPRINFVPWAGQLLWFHFLLKEGIIIAHKLHRAVGGLDWTVQVGNFAGKCTCAQDTLKVNSEASRPAMWLGRSGVGLGSLCPETCPPRGFWCRWCRRLHLEANV